MKNLVMWTLCGCLFLGFAQAVERGNLATQLEARIDKQAWSPERKALWLKAVRAGLADEWGTVVDREDPALGLFVDILRPSRWWPWPWWPKP